MGKSFTPSLISDPDAWALDRFFSASADAVKVQKEFISALAPSPEAVEKIGQYFYKKTTELVSAASYSLISTNTKSVNIVADVLKLVPVYWAASEIVRMLCLNIMLCVFSKLIPLGWYHAQRQTASIWCLHSPGVVQYPRRNLSVRRYAPSIACCM